MSWNSRHLEKSLKKTNFKPFIKINFQSLENLFRHSSKKSWTCSKIYLPIRVRWSILRPSSVMRSWLLRTSKISWKMRDSKESSFKNSLIIIKRPSMQDSRNKMFLGQRARTSMFLPHLTWFNSKLMRNKCMSSKNCWLGRKKRTMKSLSLEMTWLRHWFRKFKFWVRLSKSRGLNLKIL